MKTLNKLAALVAVAAFASISGAQEIHNFKNTDGQVWKNADGQCWRDASWTPETAAPGCDGAVAAPAPMAAMPMAAPAAPAPAAMEAPAPMAVPAPAAAPAPMAAPAPVAAAPAKVSYATEVYFDSGKSSLKAEGKAKLDDLVSKVKGINLEVIIAVGNTDKTDPKINEKLSQARADQVKAYLVSKGIEKNRVYTEGKGDKQPVADNKTAEGRAKNRRVEIEVVGTRPAN